MDSAFCCVSLRKLSDRKIAGSGNSSPKPAMFFASIFRHFYIQIRIEMQLLNSIWKAEVIFFIRENCIFLIYKYRNCGNSICYRNKTSGHCLIPRNSLCIRTGWGEANSIRSVNGCNFTLCKVFFNVDIGIATKRKQKLFQEKNTSIKCKLQFIEPRIFCQFQDSLHRQVVCVNTAGVRSDWQ